MAQTAMLGHKVRRLRRDRSVSQVALAGQLGISPSYLNLIEHNQRQLTLPLLLKVSRLFEVDLEAFSDEHETRLLGDLIETFGDPLFRESRIDRDDLSTLVNASPAACRAVVELYRAYRTANDNARGMSDRLSDDAFISSSIHELLTLLTSIRSFSEILHDHADMGAEERQKFLGIIVGESERLTDAVGQLVEIARGDALEGIVGSRPPAEEVSEFLERNGNHFSELDAEAESLHEKLKLDPAATFSALAALLERQHEITVERIPGPVNAGEANDGTAPESRLLLDESLPPSSAAFALGRHIALLDHDDLLASCLAGGEFSSPEAEAMARRALAGYFAGALLMPYERFTEAARKERYDVERLAQRFGAGFEQVCHRLTTLQRPGDAAIPFHFVRVDVAGNISKRFMGSGLRIPRFSGACPRWAVHAALLTPGRIVAQPSEMPDGTAYFSIACTVTKPGSGHHAPRSHFAVEIGCGIGHAGDIVYADAMDLVSRRHRMPIGISCRLCERTDCDQRAQPQLIRRGPPSS
ncbi:MAG TPA: short-chain fatty acyl-CoA regulator family protein [Alphaproteobacteria bacterium]|nr:short-chain fatty acyl-CoA regulator family protein [Alphaproteobacteria bacterium]